jgi:cytidylate kinase
MLHDCACQGPVVIDGPAGSGKSTVAKALARRLGYVYLDTGAMYRALAWAASRRGLEATDGESLAAALRSGAIAVTPGGAGAMKVTIDGHDPGEELRGEAVGRLASRISACPEVRREMVVLQREAGTGGRVVAEGRDMGTVVFPDAPFKFYLDADPGERAKRRWKDEVRAGKEVALEAVATDLEARDRRDTTRPVAPLKPAADAVRIDSTGMTIDEVVEAIWQRVTEGSRPD